MFLKLISLALVLILSNAINSSTGFPTVAVENNLNPSLAINAEPRTFNTLGSLFGNGYSSNYRYPDSHRGYPNYGTAYAGSVYAANPAAPVAVVPQQVVPGYAGAYAGYGGYGWRGSSDNRGYGQQSGWANRGTSGWSGNYGR